MTTNQAIAALVQFAVANGKEAARPGRTTDGVKDTFEPFMCVELDEADIPRCAWINTIGQRGCCFVSLRNAAPVVSYGRKDFARPVGRVEKQPIRLPAR